MTSPVVKKAIDLIFEERKRQDAKWGVQHHPYLLYKAILDEELGELAEAWLQTHFGGDKGGAENVQKELVQVCAVSLAMLETLLECGAEPFIGASLDQTARPEVWEAVCEVHKLIKEVVDEGASERD